MAGLSNLAHNAECGCYVAGLRGEVWALLRRGSGRDSGFVRTRLGDFDLANGNAPMRVQLLRAVNGPLFVVAGVLRHTQRPLKVWCLGSGEPVALENVRELDLGVQKEGKLRGFGGACMVSADVDEGSFEMLVACGLGIGKAHIWKMKINLSQERYACDLSYLGSVTTRRNSISAMSISPVEVRAVAAADGLTQVWNLQEIRCQGSPFCASSKLGKVVDLNEQEDSLIAFHQEFNMNELSRAQDFLLRCSDNTWALLIADESDYEGGLNSKGLRNGKGCKSWQDNDLKRNVFFTGDWRFGEMHGEGVLRDENTGEVLYEGSWESGMRSGHGRQIDFKEEYLGEFLRNQRNGFGKLRFLKRSSMMRAAGETYEGFFKDGNLHGIGKWTFPAGSKVLNCEEPDLLLPLGKITCIAVFRNGKLLRELLFKKADGQTIHVEERQLLECGSSMDRNLAFSKPRAFADDGIDEWLHECNVCWMCLQLIDETSVECSTCFLRLHVACARRLPNCPMCSCVESLRPLSAIQVANALQAKFFGTYVMNSSFGSLKRDGQNLLSDWPKRLKGESSTAPPPPMSFEEREKLSGSALARRLGKKFRAQRTRLQLSHFEWVLAQHRASELSRRKTWSAELSFLTKEKERLENKLELAEKSLCTHTLRLSRLQGRDLKAMRFAELTSTQETLEIALSRTVQLWTESLLH